MPRERRVQAHANAATRRGNGRAGGSPALLILGVVVVAVSLVGIGTLIALKSLEGVRPGGGPATPAPTPTRAAPTVITVGGPNQSPDGATTPGSGGPGLSTPAGRPAPVFAPPSGQPASPSEPAAPPSGSALSAGAAGEPSPAASGPATDPSPGTEAAPAAGASPVTAASPADAAPSSPRVEQALARLQTNEDLVGQLFLLGWIGSTAEEARPALQELRAGGIVYVQNATTQAEARTINAGLRRIADEVGLVPPLIAIDHEGGIVQRIKDVPDEGNNGEFGSRQPSNRDACERGRRHAEVLRRMGFSMNLAPVLDVNNNPANPVIGVRSYSANPETVARLGAAYIRGLQGGGVAAVGKHFPGHGNTSVDSHLQLPSLPQTVEELATVELVPFERAIREANVAAIMSAHIVFPAVDPSGAPATLSYPIMTGLLRERLGFQGLVISDDLGAMRAITDHYGAGDAAVRAVQAGVDLLIMSAELPRQRQARDAVLDAVRTNQISRERLIEAVRHVLDVKDRVGLLGEPAQTGAGCS